MFCLHPSESCAAFGAICRGVITSFISCPSPPAGAPTFPPVCWEGLGRAGILELRYWPHSACALHPPHRLLCSCPWDSEPKGGSGAQALGPSLGQQCGNIFGTNLNQSFYVLEKMRALHVPRSIGGGGVGAVEGLHSPRGAGLAALSCQPHARRASVLQWRFVSWASAAQGASIPLGN